MTSTGNTVGMSEANAPKASGAEAPSVVGAAGVIREYLDFITRTLPRDEQELGETKDRLANECASRLAALSSAQDQGSSAARIPTEGHDASVLAEKESDQ